MIREPTWGHPSIWSQCHTEVWNHFGAAGDEEGFVRRIVEMRGEGPICLPDAQGIPVSWMGGWMFLMSPFFLFGSSVSCSHVVDNFLFGYKSFPFSPPKTRRSNFLLKWSFFQGSMLVSRGVIPCFYPFTLLVVFSIPRFKKKGDQPIGWHGFLLQFACWKFDRHPRCQP